MNIGNNESLIITEAKVYKKSSAGTLHPGLCVIAGCNQSHIPHPSIEITRKRSMNGFEVS
jgi:hypothetical protein